MINHFVAYLLFKRSHKKPFSKATASLNLKMNFSSQDFHSIEGRDSEVQRQTPQKQGSERRSGTFFFTLKNPQRKEEKTLDKRPRGERKANELFNPPCWYIVL